MMKDNELRMDDTELMQQLVLETIHQTNELIYHESTLYREFEGMGTTVVLTFFQPPNTMHIANVGDSRAYLFRMKKLEMLTEDHTVTASMLRDGTIKASEAKHHPYQHYLSQSIGTSKNVKPFSSFFHLLPDDTILLCTDGLWNALSDDEITKILQKQPVPKKACRALINAALDHNSQDNISCILIQVNKKKIIL